MPAPRGNFVLSFVCLVLVGWSSGSAASLGDSSRGDVLKPATYPTKGAILEAFLNYLFYLYPSSNTEPMKWDRSTADQGEFTQGTPKRLYYAPRPGKRSVPSYEDESSLFHGDSELNGVSRWKRSAPDFEEEDKEEENRLKRGADSESSDDEADNNKLWWWSKAAVRRSPFSPRLGKRDDEHFGDVYNDDGVDANDNEGDDYLDDDSDDDLMDDAGLQGYESEFIPVQRLTLRSALVPRLGKKAASFSPRLGKRGAAFSPRLGKRGDFSFSPRLGKRGDFSFSPRLGKKADFSFSPRLGKRGDFAFSPRLGKKSDFAFSPRLGKRGDFAFSPRLGKKSDFAFNPRLGKRRAAFSPRLGKRDHQGSPVDDLGTDVSDFIHLQQRSASFSPRLG